ncbi:Peptidyl-prolyl cis-trans isomerase FKBP2 [Holothuria leucospilota]|uniref:peptidylprolyl isomerase n=1 Tax=Holothuria leucospilota TaxID=206669 RepID=A0A9Q1CHD6_HOLLE|nr:Peptidyl-prolyl cis-trans isomerase FKBP2 [Holothuria leucospilota]
MNIYQSGIILSLSIFMLITVTIAEDEVTELKIEVLTAVEDCETKTRNGDTISMHYTGTLLDGTEFDSSYPRGQPLTFKVGTGRVIKGWDQGLLDMCVGEKRKLTIPYTLAYGERGFPPKIPAKATLVFEAELMKIDRKEEL